MALVANTHTNQMTTQPITCPICGDSGIIQRHPFIVRCKCGRQPIATAGEEKGYEIDAETREITPSPASADPHAGSNISARCVRGEHAECEFGVLCECECHKEDSWNVVAASAEREQPASTLKESFRAEAFARAKTMHKVVHRVAFDALFDEIWDAIESDHQLARAQDKARIAGLETFLALVMHNFDGMARGQLWQEYREKFPGQHERVKAAAELNRNTEK